MTRWTKAERMALAQRVAADRFSELAHIENRGGPWWTPWQVPEYIYKMTVYHCQLERVPWKHQEDTAKMAREFYEKYLDEAMHTICGTYAGKKPELAAMCRRWSGADSEMFSKILSTYLNLPGSDLIALSDKFDTLVTTVNKWAKGELRPHVNLQNEIVKWILEWAVTVPVPVPRKAKPAPPP